MDAMQSRLRQEKLDALEECIQIRHQPLRVVLWDLEGRTALQLAAANDIDHANRLRSQFLSERIAAWDEFMARHCDK